MENRIYYKGCKIDKYLLLASKYRSVIEFWNISKSRKSKTNIEIDQDLIREVDTINKSTINSIKNEKEYSAPIELAPFIIDAIKKKSKLIITTAISLYEKKMEELYKESLKITNQIETIIKETKEFK